jgi:hypothetical protein
MQITEELETLEKERKEAIVGKVEDAPDQQLFFVDKANQGM